jgi:hypothetical protein
LKRFFVWPVLAFQLAILFPLLLAATLKGTVFGSLSNWLGGPGLVAALSIANTFLGTSALCWLGFWFGLKVRHQLGAIVWAVCLAIGVPSVISLLGLMLWGVLFSLTSSPMPGGVTRTMAFRVPIMLMWLPELCILGYYLWLLNVSRRCLRKELAGERLDTFCFVKDLLAAVRAGVGGEGRADEAGVLAKPHSVREEPSR